jgi:hypothetical protein
MSYPNSCQTVTDEVPVNGRATQHPQPAGTGSAARAVPDAWRLCRAHSSDVSHNLGPYVAPVFWPHLFQTRHTFLACVRYLRYLGLTHVNPSLRFILFRFHDIEKFGSTIHGLSCVSTVRKPYDRPPRR